MQNTHVGMFCISGVWNGEGDDRTQKTHPSGHVFHVPHCCHSPVVDIGPSFNAQGGGGYAVGVIG